MSDERKNVFEVKWRIENIETWFQKRDDTLYSPPFVAEPLSNTRWKLNLSTNWQLAEKCISLALQRDVDDDGPESITVNYELSLLSRYDSPLKSKSRMEKFASKTTSRELSVKEIEVLKERKEAYLPGNVLTVRCILWKTWSKVSTRGSCSIRSVVGTKCITLDGAIDNFNNKDASNISLNVNFKSSSPEISFISFSVFQNKINYHNVTFAKKEVKCNCFSWYTCNLFLVDPNGKHIELCESTDLKSLLDDFSPITFYASYKWEELKKKKYLQNGTLKMKLYITYYPGIESECIVYNTNNDLKLDHLSVDLKKMDTSKSGKKGDIAIEKIDQEFKNLNDTEKNEYVNEDEYIENNGCGNFPSSTFQEDLTSLFNDRLFCDAKLQNDSETFPAHKCVLSARSPVFKKMFTTDMKEAVGGCINVPDISSDTLRRMLQFFYTDRAGDLDMQSTMDLYVASDKYDIASLKECCLSFMKKNLQPSNVCEVLVLADLHQDKNLESSASEYVLNYDEEVLDSDEWKTFMQNYSGLAARVMYLKCFRK